ncbi:enoyl-CoA delta isomerase 1, mitochondrial isoform X1 [Hypanus sabinus]|uniref:enoyl-CoA delta isomerase 1, mitochondrial isoform X1 n=2 Tax=Hypanus sabinus TaxID=79690 RepID=UPI0028C4E2A9|nr:enoyl-CoA delta isomerase 1, mitochondrial isoform X1 [Hypanus sabinus]
MAALLKAVRGFYSGHASLNSIKSLQYKPGRILCLLPCKASGQRRSFTNKNMIVELDNNSAVAVIKMKRPPVNSLNLEFLTEFAISLEKLEMDRRCRGVILTSSIPNIFSAGLDITEMYGKSPEHTGEFWRSVQEMWLKLYGSNLVTIAAINGASPAGGCLMAMACDYRIMTDNPKYGIGLNETKLGIVAPFWFKDTMKSTIGRRATEHSLQLGILYSAPEALKIGLVDRLVAQDKIMSTALSTMSEWLTIPDHARQITKTMMRKPILERLLTQREADIQNFVNFISKDSIQKSLEMYMEMLKQRKS